MLNFYWQGSRTPPSPPDQSDHCGQKRNLPLENLVGLIVHKFLGPRHPPPPTPASTTALWTTPSLLQKAGGGWGGAW